MYCNKVEIVNTGRSVPKFEVGKFYDVQMISGKGYVKDEYGGLVAVKELNLVQVEYNKL